MTPKETMGLAAEQGLMLRGVPITCYCLNKSDTWAQFEAHCGGLSVEDGIVQGAYGVGTTSWTVHSIRPIPGAALAWKVDQINQASQILSILES